MKIKTEKSVLIYTSSLYIKYSKNKYEFSLPLGEALFDQISKKNYQFFWFFREGSRLYNFQKKTYHTPFLTKVYSLLIKIDNLNRILNYKFSTTKQIGKFLFRGFFERLFWKLILNFINPKIIIGTEPSQELCIVARKKNIEVIDLEHGLRDDAYYFNKLYRYTNKGYPNYLFYSDIKDSLILEKILPKYVRNIESGYLDLIYYEKEILNAIKFYQNDKRTILYASTYKIRGSKKPHDLPIDLIKIIQKSKLNLIIRLHPKLAQSESIFINSINYLKNQLKKNNCPFNSQKISFTNPYKNSLWKDLSNANGLVSLNSSSYRYAKRFGIPVLIHSNEMNIYDKKNHPKGLYGFSNDLDYEECESFINLCLNNNKLSFSKAKKLVFLEKQKMLRALEVIEI